MKAHYNAAKYYLLTKQSFVMRQLLSSKASRFEIENAIYKLRKPLLKRILQLLGKKPQKSTRSDLQIQVLKNSDHELISAYNYVVRNQNQLFATLKNIAIVVMEVLLSKNLETGNKGSM